MDRRHFIKLTAISGTTAALTACGNPENQLIRFIPEDDLIPGVATWKPSICPLCSAGCGVIARVMEGDAEVFRNGQPGLIRMGLVKKLEGNPDDPISQGKLCSRGQPPPIPPSGPKSIIQSAFLITSRLCSIITTVLPRLTSLRKIFKSRSISAK